MAYNGTATNFVGALAVNGAPVIPGISSIPYPGNVFYVNESTGSDGNPGSADMPLATLGRALALATANQNDLVIFEGTIHLSATLTWSKNQVHLLGSDAPLNGGQRARISTASGATAFSPMVSVTGSGCMFSNFGTFYGIADNSALVCWSDTGGRNAYLNVMFGGFGSTNTGGQTGSRAFVLNTSTGETVWRNCWFGVDTVARTAANYTLEIAGNAPRCLIESCTFASYLTGSGANGSHLLIGSAGIDRSLIIKDSLFYAATASGGSIAMAQAFNVSGSAGGFVFYDSNTAFFGCTKVETASSGVVYTNASAVATTVQGQTAEYAPA